MEEIKANLDRFEEGYATYIVMTAESLMYQQD
jgi:hypothetical protein